MSIPGPALVGSLTDRINATLDSIVPAEGPVALLGFPAHRNVGDHAIWAGQSAYLARRQIRVVYAADVWQTRFAGLARRLDGGTILLSGGGNLGDLYPQEQRFREAVIEAFHETKIVQLPQTLNFHGGAPLERARTVFGRHPDFTLLVRDQDSLELAREQLGCDAVLCPDMAFALGPLEPAGPPAEEIVWLAREDTEAAPAARPPDSANARDWPGLDPDASWRARYAAGRFAGPLLHAAGASAAKLLDALARERVNAGRRLVSSGRVVVTDRLHGHILSLLVGRPNVILDNRHGKLAAFHRTWTADSELAHFAATAEDARDLARELVTGPASHRSVP